MARFGCMIIKTIFLHRKPAMFEGLEIDQYIWSVLQNKQTVEFDEVTVDQNAKVKPCLPTVIKVINLLLNFHFSLKNQYD